MNAQKYGLAVIFALVSVAVTAVLWPFLSATPFLIIIGMVIVSAWRGGFVPGMLTALIGVLSVKYFLIEPRYEIITSLSDGIQLIFFLLLTSFISGLEESRNRTEEALRQVKDELETILNTIAEGVTAQDKRGEVVFANAASAFITGQPSRITMMETSISQAQSQYELLDESGNPIAYSAMPRHRVFATGAPSELIFQQRAVNSDESRWIRLKSAPVFDDKGRVRLAVNVFRDITERRQAALMRQESELRLRKVLNNLSIFVALLKPDGCIIEVNRPALEITGLKSEDLIGKRVDALPLFNYSVQGPAKMLDSIQRAAAGETVRYDLTVQVAKDRFITIDFMLAPVYADDGVIQYLIASGIDITERHQREQEILNLTMLIESQRRRLDMIIDNVPGIVYERTGSLDSNGERSNFISGYVETMLGYSPQEWQDDLGFWEKVIHPDERAPTLQRLKAIAESGEPGVLRTRCVTKDGEPVHMEGHFGVMKNEDGSYAGICGVMTDVTERRQYEDALMKYAQELTQSNEELSQFAYVASHDLQEPLRMVTSYLQLIESRYKDKLDEAGQEFIDYAVDGATRMKSLINDLLAYSRLNRYKSMSGQVDMEIALLTAIHQLQTVIDESKATITYDPLPQVKGNESLLVQLLHHLIGNGLKFRGEAAPRLHVSCKREEDHWLFSVRDNGIGIEANYLERIFVIFQRLHPRERYPGTGIGLAICKKIVELHEGRIWTESQPGVESTFYFTIPVNHHKRIKLNADYKGS